MGDGRSACEGATGSKSALRLVPAVFATANRYANLAYRYWFVWRDSRSHPNQPEYLSAKSFASIELTASQRTLFVDRAKMCRRIQRDAGAVAALLHAACAVVFDDECFRHCIACPQFNHQVAATTAASTKRKIGVCRVDAPPEACCLRLANFSFAGESERRRSGTLVASVFWSAAGSCGSSLTPRLLVWLR